MGADTISFALTVNNVGSGTVAYRATVIAAGDPKLATISYSLGIGGSGRQMPIAYNLNVISVGVPTITYVCTVPDMVFVFSGSPAVCSVNPPFVYDPKPNPPNFPTVPPTPGADRVVGPSIPDIGGRYGAPSSVVLQSTPSSIYNTLTGLLGEVKNLGDGLRSMKSHLQKENQKKNQKQASFTEVRNARVTSKHRIFNPTDNTQYVDIEQIDALQWRNQSGQTITWRR